MTSTCTAFNACAYTTDADGNVTGRSGGSCTGAASFFWTAEGFLDSLQAGATGVKSLYDADGRLVLKRVNGVAGAYFLWDGARLLAELNGTATSKVAEYSYYPGLDQLHALVVGGAAYYAHVDGVGNVVALTDTAQAAKRTYAYGDWGTLTGGTDGLPFSGADRARWKGALWLGPEVELYYLRNRWYEPATGRFLSEDPVGLAGGVNPVVFAGANPISGFDPTGLQPYDLPEVVVTAEYAFPWPFAVGPSIVPPGGFSRPGTQGELLRHGGGGGGLHGISVRASTPGHQTEQSACVEEGLSLLANAGLDIATYATLLTGAALAARGAVFIASGAARSLTGSMIRGGVVGTVGGVYQIPLRSIAGKFVARGSADLLVGSSLAGAGAAIIAAEYNTAAGNGSISPSSGWRDLIPGSGTMNAWKQYRRCRQGD